MGSCTRGLDLDKEAINDHVGSLDEAGVCGTYSEQLEFLYGNLNILDSKASSLLAFNAIGLACLAIWLTGSEQDVFHLVLDIAFLLFLSSCLFCLPIVWLHWASTTDLKKRDEHTVRLVELRNERTIAYRRAWFFTAAAVVVVSLASVYHTIQTASIAVGFR